MITCDATSHGDERVSKLVRFLGIEVTCLTLDSECREDLERILGKIPAGQSLLFHCKSAGIIHAVAPEVLDAIRLQAKDLLVYGFGSELDSERVATSLLGREVKILPLLHDGACTVKVHEHPGFSNFTVTGKEFQAELSSALRYFETQNVDSLGVGMSHAGKPTFIHAEGEGAQVYSFAGELELDLDSPVADQEWQLLPYYAQLLAFGMYVRTVFPDSSWHAPEVGANFIIDDPHLKKRYGFVDYVTLTDTVDATQSALTIAFIPYNYSRSDPSVVRLMAVRTRQFSITVHGCDHTGGEFASSDLRQLQGLASLALERMEKHRRLTGLPYEASMVFPQGLFSEEALLALRSVGYRAAINSSVWAEGRTQPITVRDLLSVAVLRRGSVPLFSRRYPQAPFEHAFHAFFGQPLFCVEHHGYFRHGYDPYVQWVKEMATLGSSVRWMPLDEVLDRAYLIRRTGTTGEYAVRQYTDRIRLKNPDADAAVFAVEMSECEENVLAVYSNGKPLLHALREGVLTYSVEVAGGQEADVKVSRSPTDAKAMYWRPKLSYRVRAAVRRILSDVRDNYIARSPVLLNIAEGAKNALKTAVR